MKKIIYPWQRFWCPRDGTLDLSDAGFLTDPKSEFPSAYPKPSALTDLAPLRALVLLGEPGIGKTTTLEQEAARAAEAEKRDFTTYRVDLRGFSSEVLLGRRIFESAEFRAWESGSEQMVLYLDSLDEALLRIDSIAGFLADELPRHPCKRLSIRIACRTAVWPAQTLEPALKAIWGEGAVGAFELAPLRRTDVVAAARLQQIDWQEFLRAVFQADAVPFAIRPLTLNLLFTLYKREGRLPRSVVELYKHGCLALAEEANPSRRDASRVGLLAARQRLRLAGRVAATTMLANRYAIWTGLESEDVPPEDLAVSALAGETEKGEFASITVNESHIREVLDTGLFTARGPKRMGWAHQGYAEFLAALYLVENEVTPANVLKILLHPSGGLVPQLAVVAAWASALSRVIRHALIDSEPLALLRSDLARWEAEDIARLTNSLLLAFEEKRATDHVVNIANLYSRLAHPGLSTQLRAYILDSSKSVMTRRAAIMIAEACALTELKPELLGLAANASEDSSLRAHAVAALRRCGDEKVVGPVLDIMKRAAGSDPHDEIRGYALQLLWPKHLSAFELFSNIHYPSDGFSGSYVTFLHYHLPQSIVPSDLSTAVNWASSYVAKAGYEGNFHLNLLADAIFVRAWSHMDEPAVLVALVAYVRTCLAEMGNLFRGTDRKACETFLEGLRIAPELRRKFLIALAREQIDGAVVYNLKRFSLLLPEDLQWLLAMAPSGVTPDPRLSEESLCNVVERLWDLEKVVDFGVFSDAALRWPLLYKRYQFVFEGVPIDSEEAQQAKKHHQQMQSFRNSHKPEPLSPPPAARIAHLLDSFEAGNWRAFWLLNRDLTLTPTSRVYDSDLNYAITAMPGWREADPHTRERIIGAAERYLTIGKTSVVRWIGTTGCYLNDLAAFRAFILLYQQNPVAYRRVPTEVWRKWAPAIASIPGSANGQESAEAQKIVLADAVDRAPTEFVRAVCTVIRRERRRHEEGPQSPQRGPSFYHLHNVESCFNSKAVCAGIFGELKCEENTADQFATLAGLLLAVNYTPAREYVLSRLRDGDLRDAETKVAAADCLANNALLEAWPVLWPMLLKDDGFARLFFLAYSRRHAFRDTALTGLTAQQLAEVYVRLEQVFQRKDDPIHKAGEAHAVGPLDQAVHFRDQLPHQIANMGTSEAVEALRWAMTQLPSQTWLPFVIRDAQQLSRLRSWTPLSPTDIRRLVANREAQLVRSPQDLMDVLIDGLTRYEHELHGEQSPVRALWDLQAGGVGFRPVDENALSDHVRLFLKRDLVTRGVIANREVEIGRVPGAPVGMRTDIRIDAMRHAPDGRTFDTITAVVETKGCWNRELFSALRTQLYEEYMKPLAAPVGIYLVGWFDKVKWEVGDYRRTDTPDMTREKACQELNEQAEAIPAGSHVRAFVLDCHVP